MGNSNNLQIHEKVCNLVVGKEKDKHQSDISDASCEVLLLEECIYDFTQLEHEHKNLILINVFQQQQSGRVLHHLRNDIHDTGNSEKMRPSTSRHLKVVGEIRFDFTNDVVKCRRTTIFQ
ncbi:hypothetical protein CEXT_525631 [Caerostris extrusa]|uniref:Uncharacterized protein n=1 Tax=Caerostris extrusa TaxID=172846 RepID=A0AAV4WIH6_CAEEX|nr:hypothetical protein CEXT_525631 [Caerostris extrusa]